MNIIAIAKDNNTLAETTAALGEVCAADSVEAFTDPMRAVQYGMNNRIDMAFITTGFKPLDGVGLAKMLLDRYPEVRLVFIVDDSQWEYVRRLPNSRHLRTPVTRDAVKSIIRH